MTRLDGSMLMEKEIYCNHVFFEQTDENTYGSDLYN